MVSRGEVGEVRRVAKEVRREGVWFRIMCSWDVRKGWSAGALSN